MGSESQMPAEQAGTWWARPQAMRSEAESSIGFGVPVDFLSLSIVDPDDGPFVYLDAAMAILGETASSARGHVEESVAATALIEANGDRIDRLNADNQRSLDALTKS